MKSSRSNDKIQTQNNKSSNQREDYHKFMIEKLYFIEFEEGIQTILQDSESVFINMIINRVKFDIEDYINKMNCDEKSVKGLIKFQNERLTDRYYQTKKLLLRCFNDFKKFTNLKLSQFLFRKHCKNCPEVAIHLCKGKLMIIKENLETKYVICVECKVVFLKDSLILYCKCCSSEYFSSVVDSLDETQIHPATWDNYHCGSFLNEQIRCIKCNEFMFIKNCDKNLHCLKCKFTSDPYQIKWICNFCKSNFQSKSKIYNTIEFKLINSAIKETLLNKVLARPTNIPCCVKDAICLSFKHNKLCKGELYTGNLQGKSILVCSKCKSMNNKDGFSWTCPNCLGRFTVDYKNDLQPLVNNIMNTSNLLTSEKDSLDENIKEITSQELKNQINEIQIGKSNVLIKEISNENLETNDRQIDGNKKNEIRNHSVHKFKIGNSNKLLENNIKYGSMGKYDSVKTEDSYEGKPQSIITYDSISSIEKNTNSANYTLFKPEDKNYQNETSSMSNKELSRNKNIKENIAKTESYSKLNLVAPPLPNKKIKNKLNNCNQKNNSNIKECINNSNNTDVLEKKNFPLPKKNIIQKDNFIQISSVLNQELKYDQNIKGLIKIPQIEQNKLSPTSNQLNNPSKIILNKSNDVKVMENQTSIYEDNQLITTSSSNSIFSNQLNKIDSNKLSLIEDEIKTNKKEELGENDILSPDILNNFNFNVEEYKIISNIGEGSFGTIYSSENIITKQKFAIKKIIVNDDNDLDIIMSEFNIIVRYKHKNILRILGLCKKVLDFTTKALYIKMELALSDWDKEIKIRNKNVMFYLEDELINILKQIVSALCFLQENGMSHRDVKPQNILIFSDNIYKIADFGEAKELKTYNKQMETLRGTELYMSPILFTTLRNTANNNVQHNSYKSDTFSLGYCFLYAATMDFKILYDIRYDNHQTNVNKIIYSYLNKRYSLKFIEIFYRMIDLSEENRFDFIALKKHLSENF